MRNRATLAFISFDLLAPICSLTCMAACACPDEELFTGIGEFDSRDAAIRAAIPKLADAIRKCPRVKTYRIVFTAPGIYAVGRHGLLYGRRVGGIGYIGYEDDVFSGVSYGFGPYEVDDFVVQAVASKRGGLEDFAQQDRQRK